ncbi:MAG: hypothetical protein JNL02_04410 [Saprospiraceae bacterium]|nr:hypothetical protein [Saprospiraceae bacterium]
MKNSYPVSYAETEHQFHLSARAAARFRSAESMHPVYVRKFEQYRDKHHDTLALPPHQQVSSAVLPVFYLATATVEGMLLAPVLEANWFADLESAVLTPEVVSLLAVMVPLGGSLAAGVCWRQLSIAPSPWVYGKFKINWPWLLSAVLLTAAYLGLLGFLAYYNWQNNKDNAILFLIPVLGVIELFLGYFALEGLAFALVWTNYRLLSGAVVSNARKMNRHAEQCARAFDRYSVLLAAYNRTFDLELPGRSTPAILRAIAYHENEAGENAAQWLN